MKDPRYTALANLLVHHSARVKPGDRVLIEAFDIPPEFTAELINTIAKAKGLPLVSTYQQIVQRALYRNATEAQMKLIGKTERVRMTEMQCYIGVRGSLNISELSDVPQKQMGLYEKHAWAPVHQQVRIAKTRWVILRWPLASMAQSANMSTEAFEDFYFRVCAAVDYRAMEKAMKPLGELMNKTDRVHIKGPGTDLTFSIKDIGAVGCFGERNIPDGEMFTAPVRDSINGVIQYNCDTLNRGTVFSGVRLEFKNGKVIDASASSKALTPKLNEILDADEGARYVGEWSMGFNPYILSPMKDILFDEKIAGSFHLTPGNAYKEADNGNRSQVHWDMVCIQRKDWGGGEIWFDGKLIRKDGLFVLPKLKALNLDRLGK